MIQVRGKARLEVGFVVELRMTQAQFEALDEQTRHHALDAAINWHNIMGDADVDEIEVHDYIEVEEEK